MSSYIARIISRCHTAQRAHPRTGNFMLECSGKRWNSTARTSGNGQPHVTYWSQFPDFDHNANAPIKEEFRRLAKLKGWIGNDRRKKETETEKMEKKERYRREWDKCIGSDFKQHYGDDVLSLAGWQSLCQEVGLENIPQSVKKCRRSLKGKVWVNIVDLVDCRRTRTKVNRHETEEALRDYTKLTKRIFSKEAAKQNGFLTALLITL